MAAIQPCQTQTIVSTSNPAVQYSIRLAATGLLVSSGQVPPAAACDPATGFRRTLQAAAPAVLPCGSPAVLHAVSGGAVAAGGDGLLPVWPAAAQQSPGNAGEGQECDCFPKSSSSSSFVVIVVIHSNTSVIQMRFYRNSIHSGRCSHVSQQCQCLVNGTVAVGLLRQLRFAWAVIGTQQLMFQEPSTPSHIFFLQLTYRCPLVIDSQLHAAHRCITLCRQAAPFPQVAVCP